MKNKSFFLILAGVLFVLGLAVGFVVGKIQNRPAPAQIIEQQDVSDKLFNSQSASINGQITAIDGRKLMIKNTLTGATGEIPALDRILIVRLSNQSNSVATPSSDLKSIELNKDAFISLEMIEGQYQAAIIQYFTTQPSAPPKKTSP